MKMMIDFYRFCKILICQSFYLFHFSNIDLQKYTISAYFFSIFAEIFKRHILLAMMYLVIDIGNTLQKMAVFDETDTMVFMQQNTVLNIAEVRDVLQKYAITSAIYSAVGNDTPEIKQLLNQTVETVTFSASLDLPIKICYETPNTLGTDRIANAVGANALYPNQAVLSIQAGSCLVLDFVNAQNEYLGGAIAPGLAMRFHALSHFTAHLPLLEPQSIDFTIGTSTDKSILSGVINGMIGEISSWITQYSHDFNDIKVILTGGDAAFLQNSIKSSIFAASNLVLFGLYKILRLNVSKN